MGDWDYDDDAHYKRLREVQEDRDKREKDLYRAKLSGFLDSGLWVQDKSSGGPVGSIERKLTVQEVLTCGKCYSLVALEYIQEHIQEHIEKHKEK